MKLLNKRKFNFEELDLKTCIATNIANTLWGYNPLALNNNKWGKYFIDCSCKDGGSWTMYEVTMYEVFESGYVREIPPTGRVFKNYIVSLISTYK